MGEAVDNNCFEKNLLALSARNPELCSRLSAAQKIPGRYTFSESRTGRVIALLADTGGPSRALHSTVDPVKEAERLVSSLAGSDSPASENFSVFPGLGAGFLPQAALDSGRASGVLVIDYDIDGITELFSSIDYTAILCDPRVTLLIDPSGELIEKTILESYHPALHGGIRVMPLRARTESDKKFFDAAGNAIQRAIEKVSSDYSVQAHFGKRWFANIIRNLVHARFQDYSVPHVSEAALIAAGPSLDEQLLFLAERKERAGEALFVIAADTALPALLGQGLKPDAVVSIDCQHISYYHFIGQACGDVPLFLDLASPPELSAFSDYPVFFSGGHPLSLYISQKWRPFPVLDTSGGNVTYACLSLAESLGARRISVYGADFSYPGGRVYAKGTYIYRFFEGKQERRFPLEAQRSSFLYRSPFLPPEAEDAGHCYETTALRFYRKSFEQKASAMEAEVAAIPGSGMPLMIHRKASARLTGREKSAPCFNAAGKALMSAAEFLRQYRRDIENCGPHGGPVFTTLMPLAAAVKHRRPELSTPDIIEAAKLHCIEEIDRVLDLKHERSITHK